MIEQETKDELRIVCLDCVALAHVRYVARNPTSALDGIVVWVECHGKAVFGELDGETVHRGRLTLEDIQRKRDPTGYFETGEERLRVLFETVAAVQAYLAVMSAEHAVARDALLEYRIADARALLLAAGLAPAHIRLVLVAWLHAELRRLDSEAVP